MSITSTGENGRVKSLWTSLRNVSEGLVDMRTLPVAIGLILLIVFFSLESDVFLTSRNLTNLLSQSVVTGIMALGLIFVLLVGEIDLSVAAISGVTSVLMAKLIMDFGFPPSVAIAIAFLAGAGIGGLSARWITWMRVPSFVVTLGVGLVLNGVQLALLPETGRYNLLGTGIENVAGTSLKGPPAWIALALLVLVMLTIRFTAYRQRVAAGLAAPFFAAVVLPLLPLLFIGIVGVALLDLHNGVPVPVIIFTALLVVASYLTQETRIGLYLYAVGDNIEAARRSGIRPQAVKLFAFMVAGALAALAGLLASSRILGVSVSSGGGIGGGSLLLESIAAAVIGGVSLFGGKGRVSAAVFGALIIGTVSNGLNLMGVGNEIRLVVTGFLLVLAVSVDRVIERFAGPLSRD